jgi:uncharacterized protein (DUF1810 family)
VDDPYDLRRFVVAQSAIFEQARSELRAGRKQTHWMWFVFPQFKGLGASETARAFAISGLDEARAYLAHPVLGARLRECCALVNRIEGRSAHEIFGDPDDMKFRSCLTLFAVAAPKEAVFAQALARYFGGEPDPRTMAGLGPQVAGAGDRPANCPR